MFKPRSTQLHPLARRFSRRARLDALALGLAYWLVNPLSVAHADQTECVKEVFNTYCLGGVLNPTEREPFSQIGPQQYRQGDITLTISDSENAPRLTRVTRRIDQADYIRFNRLRSQLIGVYGKAIDQSTLPPSARSRSSRYNAILSGQGYLQAQWLESSFMVQLTWRNIDYIELSYQLRSTPPSSDVIEGL